MTGRQNIPATVLQKLGHYVYAYVNPIDDCIFYVGKGKGSRLLEHLDEATNDSVRKRIKEIRGAGEEPRIDLLAHGLRTSELALQIEAAVIDALGLSTLQNAVRGWKSGEIGRQSIEDVIAKYTRKRANIVEPSILIRVNQLFRYGMSAIELYDATRGIWKIGDDRDKAKYAFAVFEGVIREAYSISHWLPGGSTFYSTRGGTNDSDRWEFVGNIAEPAVRQKYINKFVGDRFKYGHQSPIHYLNIK